MNQAYDAFIRSRFNWWIFRTVSETKNAPPGNFYRRGVGSFTFPVQAFLQADIAAQKFQAHMIAHNPGNQPL